MNTTPRVYRSAAIASAAILAACLPAGAAITFANPGLDGTPGYGNAPTSWLGIPNGTPYSQATTADGSQPILLGPTGFNVANGYFGTPQSGSTFAAGIYGNIAGGIYQQGIQQTLSGFTVGETYSFSFFQAVVGYSGAQDDSGSWKVFANGTLIATTAPSTTTVAWNAPGKPLIWEERTVTFTATADTINIAFLSYDPEGIGTVTEDRTLMGIDSFSPIFVPEPSAAMLGLVGALGLLRRRRA
ncbi:hypothetical protein [Haloferula sp. BvORR071]|uniref:hypothetical protein n=1 Tax=Haloferula sp. BvORR071 TaxID=1396141 RepID=UPI00054DC27B|nr:hypothetical protein [Haloferula sp. BvORR071]